MCRRCSNYIFILNLIHGFNRLGKDNYKTRWETFKIWDLVCLLLEVWLYHSPSEWYLFTWLIEKKINILYNVFSHWLWPCQDKAYMLWWAFVYAPNQWDMMLQCNVVPHWLGAFTKWSLIEVSKLTSSLWIGNSQDSSDGVEYHITFARS